MEWNKRKIKDHGYKSFETISIEMDSIEVFETALKDGKPFIAIATKKRKKVFPASIPMASLPSSIQFLIFENETDSLYSRMGGMFFTKCNAIPKADGTTWGNHTRKDLIPVRSIGLAVDYAQKSVKPSRYESIAYILCFKLLDELSSGDLLFTIGESGADFTAFLEKLASAFGLKNEWREAPRPGSEQLEKIVMAWQPYRFLTEPETSGVFGLITGLIASGKSERFSIRDKINPLILSLLAGEESPLYMAGLSTTSLLDIALISDKGVRLIGKHHPVIRALGEKLIPDFNLMADEFLDIQEEVKCTVIICAPPIGVKITDDARLSDCTLFKDGKGKRSKGLDAEIAWLEKCERMLSRGGCLIAFLPERFLSGASFAFAREWVLRSFRIDSIISLPSTIFQPGAGVKTNLVQFYKTDSTKEDYPIFMAETEERDFENLSPLIQSYRRFKGEDAS